MKRLIILFIVGLVPLWSCTTTSDEKIEVENIRSKIKELENEFRPELGMLMNQVQTYHIKLYLSIRAQNHELISYVLHELEEQFETLINVHKVHDDIELGVIVEETVHPIIKELNKANEIKDSVLLMQSFDKLTVTCNNCHKSSDHSFIRIKIPEGEYFPNQDFAIH